MNEKYNPTLIITALPFESRTILTHHKINIKLKKLTTYQLDKSIYLIEVPIGFKFDLSILTREVEKIAPKLIINFGICGALNSKIPIGSSFYIERVCHLDNELSEIQLPTVENTFHSASLLTVDEPVLTAKRRNELYSQIGCKLVDMEAFYVARFCEARQFPLLAIKIASDFADENTLNVIKANRSVLRQSLTNAYLKIKTNSSQ